MTGGTLDILTQAILGTLISGGFVFVVFLLKWLFKTTKENFEEKITGLKDIFEEKFNAVITSIDTMANHQKEMNGAVKEIILREQECKNSLPKNYVTMERFVERKADTSQMFKDLFEITAEIREKLTFILGSLAPDAVKRGNIEVERKKLNEEGK